MQLLSISDVLRPILDDMGGGLGSIMGVNLTDVLKSPAEYSQSTATLMEQITQTVIFPAATLVLVVLYFLELSRVSLQVEGDKELFIQVAATTLVKFALLRIMFEATPIIMQGIFSLFSELATGANRLTAAATTSASTGDVDSFLQSVESMDWLGQIVLVLLLMIAWLINKGAVIAALGLVVVRFVKLYIFTAFAPVPVALFAHHDTRQFGINFLRSFAAVVLQAFVLVVAFAIYQTVTQGWAARAFSNLDSNGVTAALSIGGNFMLLGVVLGMIMLGSGRVANELVGN